MVSMKDIQEKRDDILRICQENGGHDVRVFGSVLRGEETPDSDLDLLVELDENHSLLDRIAIMQNLEQYLGCKVDVVSPRGLNKLIREDILHEAVAL